jgi:hypothetical protein
MAIIPVEWISLIDLEAAGRRLTSSSNALNAASNEQHSKVFCQCGHENTDHEEGYCRKDHGHSAKDMAERSEIGLEDGRSQQEGGT